MTVSVAYVYPAIQQQRYWPFAKRFVETWQQFPPGDTPHELVVYVNGREPGPLDKGLFAPVNARLVGRDNSAWDIGCYQDAAETLDCDLLVCLGAPVHFHRSGWMDRMVDAYVDNGPGLYGCACYLTPGWHVRTTIFWFPPILLRSYPEVVGTNRQSRYGFEHGSNSFTRHVLGLGYPAIMVTWRGIYPFDQWANHAPDRNDILARDQHIT